MTQSLQTEEATVREQEIFQTAYLQKPCQESLVLPSTF